MDSLISAAARALAAGDALAALQRVALRDDPPALALRGIAMAQLVSTPAPASCCAAQHAALAHTSPWPAPVAWWPRPRWRWPCATWADRRTR